MHRALSPAHVMTPFHNESIFALEKETNGSLNEILNGDQS